MRPAPNVRRVYKVLQGGTPRRHLLCVLREDLFAAVDWKNNPSIATAWVAQKNASGDYYLTTRSVNVVNRFENISLDAGTLVGIEWIDGEWQPYKADCTAGSESIPGSLASEGGGDSLLSNQPPGFPSP